MKKITIKNKILLLFSFLFILISTFTISSFAYHVDSNGNLVSDNLINYQDINSSKFTDLGNNSFKLNWGGSVSTITLPYTDFNENTQYSMTITKVSGANYWAYQFYWNYNDNTSEKFTNNQGLANGTYSFTSASNKTLVSITIVLNYEADFTGMMLNIGEPKSFEPYGQIYYSQSNYDNAYSSGFNTATFNSFKSIMYYANFEEIWLSYQTNNNYAVRYLGLVYAGRLCESDVTDRANIWSDPDYDYPITNNWEENISSSFGLFYMTNWSLYDFIQESADYPSVSPDREARLYMKFITPQNLFNTNFKVASWQRVRFIDIYGKITDFTSTQGVFSVELYNISEIICFGTGDFADDNYYIVSDPSSASFNSGYNLGFDDGIQQNTDKISELNSEIVSLHDTIDILQQQIVNLQNSTSNYQHLLWTVAGTPWESFNKIWNVEFGGINIANIVTGFVTALLVIYLIKKIWK